MEINVNRGNANAANAGMRDKINLRPMMGERPRVRPDVPKTPPTIPGRPSAPAEPKKDKTFIIKVFDKIISLSIFMIFFGLPLYFTGLANQGVIFEKQLWFYFWLLLGIVTWAAKGVMSGEMKIRRTPLDIPILGFFLAYIAAVVFSIDRWHSFWGAYSDPSRGLMSVTAYILAFYFIFSNFSAKRLKLILAAVLSSGAILTIWTTLAVLAIKFLPDALAQYAPVSLPGSITTLGSLIAVMVPLIMTAVLKISEAENKNLWKKILIAGLLVILAADLFLVLALSSYIPWLGFFVGIIVFLIFMLAKIIRPNPSWTWLPMTVFVLVMILRLTGAVSITKITLPVEVSLNYKTSAEIVAESVKNKPITGSGPATYGYNFSLNRPKDFNLNAFYNLRFFQGTGILAEAIPTIGIVGGVFLAILFLSYLGLQFFLLYRDKEKNKLYSLGIFSAAAILVTNALTIRTGGMILAYTILLITAALAASMMESESSEKNLNLSLKTSPKFALALAFVFMVVSAGVAFLFVFLGKAYFADIQAGRAERLMAVNQEEAFQNYSSAIRLNSRESKYFSQIGRFYMSLANAEAIRGKDNYDIEKIRQYLQYSIAVSVRAKEISKNDVTAVESLALIYENAGLYIPDSLKLAAENYNRAMELEPHNPIYWVKLGQIKVAQAGKTKDQAERESLIGEAKDLYQKSIDEKNNFAEGYYHLALAQEAMKELDQAIENGTAAVRLNSKNSNYLLALGRMHQVRATGEDNKMAEDYFKAAIGANEKDINGYFYLGLFYEKNNNRDEAKKKYNEVIGLLLEGKNNEETVGQIQKMISNVDRGIENTPQSLGLVPESSSPTNSQSQPAAEAVPTGEASPANLPGRPTIEESQLAE